jgi:hypothetical protein
MHYQVSREGQLYGPYTLEDLQRYVTSGNVLLTDLAKSEDMQDWLPVAQILGTTAAVATPAPIAPSPYPPAYPTPTGTPYPNPPNLNWVLLMLCNFLTCGIFTIVWNLILCAWVRRVQPSSNALILYISAYTIALIGTAISFANNLPAFIATMHHEPPPHMSLPLVFLASCFSLTGWIVRIVARFTLRSSIELHYNVAEPMGLYLNPVMTFFFGNVYFQFHINRLLEIKQAARYRNASIGTP